MVCFKTLLPKLYMETLYLKASRLSSLYTRLMLTAAVCQDGFVLVGSVAGQRYWSSMLPSEATVTCGAWTPDDLQVYVATAQGGLIVMDLHGNIVSKVGAILSCP